VPGDVSVIAGVALGGACACSALVVNANTRTINGSCFFMGSPDRFW
jgi:hypothetical protein